MDPLDIASDPKSADTSPPDKPRHRGKAYWIKFAIRLVVLILVVGGIWYTVDGARDDFADKGFSPRNLNYGWLALACLFYLLGLLPACCFWRTTMVAMGQRPGWLPTIRA